jgi:hypothetical protein
MLRARTAQAARTVQARIASHRSEIEEACMLAGVALGLVLMALFILEAAHSTRLWLVSIDFSLALLAIVGAGTLRTESMIGVAVWTFVAVVLAGTWLLGMALGTPAWLAATHFALAFCFAGLALLGSAAHP